MTTQTPMLDQIASPADLKGRSRDELKLIADELRADIKAQMQSRVRWTESVQLMLANGIQTFVEAGTGDILLGLIKRIDASTSRFPLGTPQNFAALEE